MADPVWVQLTHQGRNDDGGLGVGGATYIGTLGSDWTQEQDVPFRVRFVIQQTNASKTVQNQMFELFQNYNSGGFVQVTSISTELALVNDANSIADDAATVQDIGSGTYSTGESLGYCDGTSDNDTGNCDFNGAEEVEVEFCCQIQSTDVTATESFILEIRLSGGGSLDTYTDRPTVTVGVVADESSSSSSSLTSSSSSVTSSSSSLTSSSSSQSTSSSQSADISSVSSSSSVTSSSSSTSSSSASSESSSISDGVVNLPRSKSVTFVGPSSKSAAVVGPASSAIASPG